MDILQLHAFVCLCCLEVKMGYFFSAFKLHKVANFPDGRTQTVGDGNFYIEPKNCPFGLLKKPDFSYTVIKKNLKQR